MTVGRWQVFWMLMSAAWIAFAVIDLVHFHNAEKGLIDLAVAAIFPVLVAAERMWRRFNRQR